MAPMVATVAEAARETPGVTAAIPLIEQPLMASYDGRVEGVLRLDRARTAVVICSSSARRSRSSINLGRSRSPAASHPICSAPCT